MAHVTCVGASRAELAAILDEVAAAGVVNVLALRGDPPRGEARFRLTRTASASRASWWPSSGRAPALAFCIGAAAYPEGHPESGTSTPTCATSGPRWTRGADFLVTQLFFDNAALLRVRRAGAGGGDHGPDAPGIMPFTNVEQVERFTAMCGAAIPPRLRAAMEVRREDADAARELGVAYATLQCADLLRRGAPGIHFYTLNRSPSTRAIVAALRASEPWRA